MKQKSLAGNQAPNDTAGTCQKWGTPTHTFPTTAPSPSLFPSKQCGTALPVLLVLREGEIEGSQALPPQQGCKL